MSEQHVWAWKRRDRPEVVMPQTSRKTIEELFKFSSFGLPVRDVASHVPIRVTYDAAAGKWIEEDEKDRLWRTVVAASSR
jgi:hypothetical protein